MARPRWVIVGAGSFGTTFAHLLRNVDIDVTLAARTREHADSIADLRRNERYFPELELAEDLHVTTVDEAAQQTWDVVVLAVPTRSFRETLERFSAQAPVFLSLAKGLDPSGRRLGEVAGEIVRPEQFVVLSGPNIASEMVRDLPTAAVLACVDMQCASTLQQQITTAPFRVYTNPDVIGVELAGASKNVVAIAAGVLEGAGMGDNGIAAMMTRGLGEMARLGLAYGATLQTYLGLAGVGDLMVTCRSPHSRNHRAGRLLADGLPATQIREQIGQAIEGFRAAPIVRDMARAKGIEMHICEAVGDIVEHGLPLSEVVRGLMARPPGTEFSSPHEFSASV
jgi:glycerol-3-phosphate dehydrogenase (NAD(P)+)